MTYEVGQVFIRKPEYFSDKRNWVRMIKIDKVLKDAAIITVLDSKNNVSMGKQHEIGFSGIEKEWSLCPEYKALQQFDKELEELLK
jgi:hypothetical protein